MREPGARKRPKRRHEEEDDEPAGSLAPLWWTLGILVFVGAVAAVVIVVLNNSPDDNPPLGGQPNPFPGQPNPNPGPQPKPADPASFPPQVSVLPKMRGKDPLKQTPKLQQTIAGTDKAWQKWRLVDLEARRPQLDPSKNSAVQILVAARLLPPNWQTPQGGIAMEWDPPTEPLRAEQVQASRAALAQLPGAVAEARKLVNFPAGRFRIVYHADMLSTPVPHVQDVVRIGRLLGTDAMLRAHDGDAEGALHSCWALIHTARSLAGDPLSISQTARAALMSHAALAVERALVCKNSPSENMLRGLQQVFEDEANAPTLSALYWSERATFHALLTNVSNGDASIPGAPPGVTLTGDDHAWLLDLLNRAVVASTLPPQQRQERFNELPTLIAGGPKVAKLLAPDVAKINRIVDLGTCRLHGAALALAVERYRIKHGQWPANLNALVPAFIKAVPTDPLAGSYFKLGPQQQGVSVYTHATYADHGGRFDMMGHDFPRNQGVRLLHPNLRR